MAKTASKMRALGEKAQDFSLPNLDGKKVSLKDFSDRPLLVMFICNHCPFVKHIRGELASIGKDYAGKNLGIVAINSNDVTTHPEDSPAQMKIEAAEAGYLFPYLFDETQSVAKSYEATCTPDFFLFDSQHSLVYRGQLDDSRPGSSIPVTGKDLRQAMDAVLAGNRPSIDQRPSLGCNIKWK